MNNTVHKKWTIQEIKNEQYSTWEMNHTVHKKWTIQYIIRKEQNTYH